MIFPIIFNLELYIWNLLSISVLQYVQTFLDFMAPILIWELFGIIILSMLVQNIRAPPPPLLIKSKSE